MPVFSLSTEEQLTFLVAFIAWWLMKAWCAYCFKEKVKEKDEDEEDRRGGNGRGRRKPPGRGPMMRQLGI